MHCTRSLGNVCDTEQEENKAVQTLSAQMAQLESKGIFQR